MSDELTFRAVLPQDAQAPVKPSRDFNPGTQERRTRIWLDGFLRPGDGERLLLLGDSAELEVTVRRKPAKTYGPVSHVGDAA